MLCQYCGITLQKVRLVTICSIYIIILSIQLNNIPCMSLITVCSISLHINTWNIQPFQQILNRTRITCTHCLLFPESSRNALIIIRNHIIGIVYDIRVNRHYLGIVICTFWNLRQNFLICILHSLRNLLPLILCISISRRKLAVIPACISCFIYLLTIMYPEHLRMILKHCMIHSVYLVISGKRQVKLLFKIPDTLQNLAIASLLILVKKSKIIFLMSFI